MKIKNYKCRCGNDDFFLSTPENCIGENHVGIYCSSCGKWFKWADKDEKNLAMNCVTKIRNDLIKNGDDLIKRQDAIDACFNGKCANIYDCKEAIEKIPSAQKTGHWIITEVRQYDLAYGGRIYVPEYRCSCCGHWYESYVRGDEPKMPDDADFPKYCEQCGARMECEDDG